MFGLTVVERYVDVDVDVKQWGRGPKGVEALKVQP